MTLKEIAALVAGRLLAPENAGDVVIRSVRSMSDAGPSDLTFLANPKYKNELGKVRAGAILLSEPVEGIATPQILVTDPYLALAKVMQLFYPLPRPIPGIHPKADVSPGATIATDVQVDAGATVSDGVRIGKGTLVYPNVFIGRNVVIGENCLIYPGVVIREECVLGNRVIIQPNAVIGSDGFGYAADKEGRRHKIPQIGKVVIHDDVEIGSGATIDRATFGETVVGRGTKIDNLVQIAHNVKLGEDCVIVAQAGISGSSRLGNRVILAGQAGVVGHIDIGSDSIIGAQSGVAQSLPEKSRVTGSPAVPHALWLRIQAILKDLPSIVLRFRNLEKKAVGTREERGEDV
jgi:UDP-3-O-[3-hydroxymyristoyl] glucosamine N-acyltransferase